MNGGWPGGRELSALLIPMSLSLLQFKGLNSFFFGKFSKIHGLWDSVMAAQGLAANWSLGGENKSIVYSLFCVFIIIIIIIRSIISISFVALLKCLSQQTSFPFCLFLHPILLGGKGKG